MKFGNEMRLSFMILVLLAIGTGCGDRRSEVETLLPQLDPGTVAQLTSSESDVFLHFVAATSTDRLIDIRDVVVEVLFGEDTIDEHERSMLKLILSGLDDALAEDRGLAEFSLSTSFLASLPVDQSSRVIERRLRAATAFADPELVTADKYVEVVSIRGESHEAGDLRGMLQCDNFLAILELRQQGFAAAERLQRRRFETGREAGYLVDTCHAWGQLLMINMHGGWSAAQYDTMEHFQNLADHARLAGTSSYLTSLVAYQAHVAGRNVTARALFEDSIDICRTFGEPTKALSPMIQLLRHYAFYECWNQVDALLVRADQLLAEYEDSRLVSFDVALFRARHAALTARSLASRGRADDAHAAFQAAFDEVRALPYEEGSYLLLNWFNAMVNNDRLDLAEEVLATVEQHDDLAVDSLLPARIPFWRAWIAWRSGDLATAISNLDQFAAEGMVEHPEVVKDLEFHYKALRARVLWPSDPDLALATLTDGWRELAVALAAREPGPEVYLELANQYDLREAAQELIGGDPEIDYGLDLLWRDLFLPRWPRADILANTDLEHAARERSRHVQAELRTTESIHCVYQVRRDRVVRMTTDGHGVERSVVPGTVAELRTAVFATLAHLSADPGSVDAVIPGDLIRELTVLADLLLPATILDGSESERTLYVSGESFLAQIPFSPLNLGGLESYSPLVESLDVAWLHGGRLLPGNSRESASLVIAAPTVTAATRRRFEIAADLQGATAELADITALYPDAVVLRGDSATGEAIVAGWRHAPLIYYIGHAVIDPEDPLGAWLPVAADDLVDPYPGIGIKDVLSATFDNCNLVVLSGCATGAPYVDGFATAPSLGDAFLDAGAAATIQTFWRVKDDAHGVVPARILRSWRNGMHLAKAMSTERRQVLRGPEGILHPFSWAAWTVKQHEP